MEIDDENKPPDNTGKKYITKITPKQQKFIDLYTSKYGNIATECAIRADMKRAPLTKELKSCLTGGKSRGNQYY